MDLIHDVTIKTLLGVSGETRDTRPQYTEDEMAENESIVADLEGALRDITAMVDALRIDKKFLPSSGSMGECVLDFLRARIQLKEELDGTGAPVPKCLRMGFDIPMFPDIDDCGSVSSASSSGESDELGAGDESRALGDADGEDFMFSDFPDCR